MHIIKIDLGGLSGELDLSNLEYFLWKYCQGLMSEKKLNTMTGCKALVKHSALLEKIEKLLAMNELTIID